MLLQIQFVSFLYKGKTIKSLFVQFLGNTQNDIEI